MAENAQDDATVDRPSPLQAAGSAAGGDEPTDVRETDANRKDGGGKKEEEDDDAALARMMAFQEEEEDATATATAGAVALGNDAGLDPNVAFLGDPGGAGGGDDDGNEDDADAVHPNLNNPAAVALRQRQALQNAARLNPDAALQGQPYLVRKLFSFLRGSLGYTRLSLLAAFLLVHHTLRTRQQFYLALTYLQSSKLAYILLGNAVIALAVSAFSLLTRMFLDGGLRPNERDSIGEHIRWDVTETCLALTIFRSELDVLTAIEFLGLVIMKCLHWSVELRGNHLRMTEEVFVYPDEDEDDDADENSAENPPRRTAKKRWYRRVPHLRLTHVRYYTLVQVLLLLDIFAVAHCALSVATHGPSVDILFGFEFAILLIAGLSSMGMYHLHVIDGIMGVFHHLAEGEHHHVPVGGMVQAEDVDENEPERNDVRDGGVEQQQQREGEESRDGASGPPTTRTKTLAKKLVERLANPWRDRRATLSFAIELQAQAAKFLFYMVFFAIVFTYYGMPINIFREVYVSFQQLRRRLIAFNTYRRLTHNMDKRFESIESEEELDRLGRTCIICRDQMDLLGGCKKLPGCGHAFHAHCLREWLVQQQTCPTCRADIAANEARMKKQRERERVAAEAAAAAEAVAAFMDGREAGGAAATGANDAAAADDATRSSGGPGNSAGEPQEQARVRAARSETNTAAAGAGPDQRSTSTPDDALPEGWTQHVDTRSGRTYYYNNELVQSSWEKPVARTADNRNAAPNFKASTSNGVNGTTPTPSADVRTFTKNLQSGFPCLYQIIPPNGAPVFSSVHSPGNMDGPATASPAPPQRFVSRGKLIVCTAIEYWPFPFQEAMLRMPDGYVRARDVDRFLMLGETPGEGGAGVVKMRAVGVAR
eukprot:CAMPEP_0172555186 /NCGR_PEP_ID=MMETSP1067-20121228/58287_1 /TAXON_ID=265564 ORGANISM="Thalassiosira punctigera, Strain Tpunct2005C2" /NCGR_SAMPLE_ID=MMETSP1067 /ASSEMBLY_ACC=CAM_ASM_000444 /LENGTH=880 /DNA_ID=CAMNT_0013343699 /DNA_START=66 /DNA_END=2708 /DNA_ORIENTATION=+